MWVIESWRLPNSEAWEAEADTGFGITQVRTTVQRASRAKKLGAAKLGIPEARVSTDAVLKTFVRSPSAAQRILDL
jgi:hypothetical protein